jgi:zinc transporter, ZIP family
MSSENERLARPLAGIAQIKWSERLKDVPLVQRNLIWVGLSAFALTLLTALILLLVNPYLAYGAFASLFAGLATGLGCLPLLVLRKPIEKTTLNLMLGGAAGVMLAATSFSLLSPAINAARAIWPVQGIYVIAIGLLAGAFFLILADRVIPYHHYIEQDEHFDSRRKVWLFIIAVAVHNLPEGWAVGVTYGAGDGANGLALALAIAMQNVPEGLAVALPLMAMRYSPLHAIGIATLTGLIEPLGGLLGLLLAHSIKALMPIGMAFAAGAMLFVILDDIVPAIQEQGKERKATMAVLLGFVLMMILDNAVGS